MVWAAESRTSSSSRRCCSRSSIRDCCSASSRFVSSSWALCCSISLSWFLILARILSHSTALEAESASPVSSIVLFLCDRDTLCGASCVPTIGSSRMDTARGVTKIPGEARGGAGRWEDGPGVAALESRRDSAFLCGLLVLSDSTGCCSMVCMMRPGRAGPRLRSPFCWELSLTAPGPRRGSDEGPGADLMGSPCF